MAKAAENVIVVYGETFDRFDLTAERKNRAAELLNTAMSRGEVHVGFDPGKPFDVGASDDMVFVFVDKHEPTEAQQLGTADLHITMAGGRCGNTACTRCDPMERYVDGLTVRECLERFTTWQRTRDSQYGGSTTYFIDGVRLVRPWTLTHAQTEAARLAWSAELRRKRDEARSKERSQVVVQDQWGDDD